MSSALSNSNSEPPSHATVYEAAGSWPPADAIYIWQDDRLVFVNAHGIVQLRAANAEQLIGLPRDAIFGGSLRGGAVSVLRCIDGDLLEVDVANERCQFGGRNAVQMTVRARNVRTGAIDDPARQTDSGQVGIGSDFGTIALTTLLQHEKLLMYYDNNVGGSVTLLQAMAHAGVRHFVFSSSATVYGDPESVPIREDARLRTTNAYGGSKLMVEQILADLAKSSPGWAIGVLRYFNPVGAHASGRIGEDPRGIPNNLMPYIGQVAVGRREQLSVYGDDYSTVDGTGVRDYIHVVDLALGHVAALRRLLEVGQGFTVNLGTGHGCSVLELLKAFEHASGKPIPYRIVDRRPGDIAKCFANAALARELLGWQAQRNIAQMCDDQWRWQSSNPAGFA